MHQHTSPMSRHCSTNIPASETDLADSGSITRKQFITASKLFPMKKTVQTIVLLVNPIFSARIERHVNQRNARLAEAKPSKQTSPIIAALAHPSSGTSLLANVSSSKTSVKSTPETSLPS